MGGMQNNPADLNDVSEEIQAVRAELTSFFVDLENYRELLEEIREDIKSINKSLKDIFELKKMALAFSKARIAIITSYPEEYKMTLESMQLREHIGHYNCLMGMEDDTLLVDAIGNCSKLLQIQVGLEAIYRSSTQGLDWKKFVIIREVLKELGLLDKINKNIPLEIPKKRLLEKEQTGDEDGSKE